MQATASKPKRAATTKVRSAESERRAGGAPAAPGARHQNEGHGRRLTMAFEALEAFPALAESRNRLLAVMSGDHVATADIVTAVESDVALIIAVLRVANQAQSSRVRVDTVVAAVELLSPAGRAGARRARAHLRLLRALERLGRGARALPAARAGDAARRRPHRHRGRLRAPRPPDRRRACCTTSASSCCCTPTPAIPRRCTSGRRPPRNASIRSAASWASTTRWSAACSRGAGACRVDRDRDRAPSQPGDRRRGRLRPPGRHARPLRAGRPGLLGGDAADRPRSSASARRSCGA